MVLLVRQAWVSVAKQRYNSELVMLLVAAWTSLWTTSRS